MLAPTTLIPLLSLCSICQFLQLLNIDHNILADVLAVPMPGLLLPFLLLRPTQAVRTFPLVVLLSHR